VRRMLRFVVVALVCFAVSGLVGACGGDGGKAPETFRIGGAGAATFDSPNPFVATSIDALSAFRYMYPYLVQYDRQLDIVGSFASKWSTSADGREWTFSTQPDAKWSDGKPLTAADAAWTLNTMLKYKGGATAGFAPYLVNITEVTAPSPDSLVISVDKRISTSAFLSHLQVIPILPEHVWAEHATGKAGIGLKRFANTPDTVSGGPFTLEKFNDRNIALFTRNENWWGPKPHIESWGLQHYSSPDALVQALKANEIDLALRLPPTSVKTIENANGLSIKKGTGMAWADIGFNSNPKKPDKPEIRDPQFRLAFAAAIDREKLIETFLLGAGTPGVSIIPPSDGRWFNKDLEAVPHDPAKANEILDGLGFRKGPDGIRMANGHKMSYELIYLDTGNNRMVELIQSDLKEVGIELVPKLVGDAAYVPAVEADDYTKFDLSMDYWGAQPDPDYILSTQTCANLDDFSETAYCSKTYDDLYQQQAAEADDDQRERIVWQMQELLAKDRPYDVLFYPDALEGVSDKWTGLVFSGNGSFNGFSNESLLSVRPAD
jgi:peptide/nickel transport system substrate-binding protein